MQMRLQSEAQRRKHVSTLGDPETQKFSRDEGTWNRSNEQGPKTIPLRPKTTLPRDRLGGSEKKDRAKWVDPAKPFNRDRPT